MSAPPHVAWETLKARFAELADLPAAERAARLAGLASTDSHLAERLTALLDADANADIRLASFELLSSPDPDSPALRATPAADPLGLVGTTVAHFRVLAVLGCGGMGVAYRAEDLRLGRSVALKFLLPQFSLDEQAKRRFLHEARTASALDHPNVCTLLEVGESPQGLFLAMPAYAGENLQQRLARSGRLGAEEATGIARQVLHGLAAAHAAGIAHRDLKPGNLMITPDGTVKILDFGLARSGDVQLSSPALRAGTVAYMSPEQLRGEGVDQRSDLWSVGVLLYEMLTGHRPFGGGHELGTLYAIIHDAPPPLAARAPGVPAHLAGVTARLLAKEPAARYESATAALTALDGEPEDATAAVATARPTRRHQRRRVLLLVAFLLLAGAAAPLLLRWAETTRRAAGAERASVAVLPFVDTSPERSQAHLGEGVAEEIRNALVAVPGLRVPARASSFRFQDQKVAIAEIARQLNVRAVLEGSVHVAGDSMRITARLLDAGSGRYLWSRTFNRGFSDIFAVQAEIARTVADTLEVRLTPAAARAPPTRDMAAYELYLRGLFHWNRRTPLDLRRAIEFFTRATQRDPNFAQPYAGLALTYVALALLDPAANELIPRAHTAAARALALDPSLAAAHAARAYAYHLQWQWPESEREFQRALLVDSSYAPAHQWYGEHLAKLGRFREGEAQMRRAIALDPLSLVAQNDLALIYLLSRRYQDAINQLERVRRMDPAFPLPLNLLHRVQLVAGNAEAAAEAGRRWAELTGSADADELELLARASQDPSLRPAASAVLERWAMAEAPRWPDIAMYRVLMGDHDGALTAIERGVQARMPMMAGLNVAPWYDPLRQEPRMQALLRRMRFP